MANDENLIPMSERSPEEVKALAIKGGKACSGEKQRIAGKIGWLRRHNKKLSAKQIDMLDEIMINPAANLIKMQNFIEEKKNLMDSEDYIRLCQVNHKLMHGEKKQIDINLLSNVTINFGVDLDGFNPDKAVEAEFEEVEETGGDKE